MTATSAPLTNHTLEKGLDILGLFDDQRARLSAQDIRRELQLSQSTLYRILRSMKAKGWIEDDGLGSFRPGLRILTLARVVRKHLTMAQLAVPVMHELSQATGESVLLTVISGQHAVCLERVDGPHTVRATLERGAVLPLHAGASATILLAFAPDAVQNAILAGPLQRYTENTVTDPAQLRKTLERIRANGYAFSDQEVDRGVRAIAAPILSYDRGLVAALSVVAPAERLSDGQVKSMGTLIKKSAAQLSDLAELRP
jgi:DNA-binding IclR family transcriptional regulator